MNEEPEQEKLVTLYIEVVESLKRRLVAVAKRNHRNLSGEVRRMLEQYLQEEEKKLPPQQKGSRK